MRLAGVVTGEVTSHVKDGCSKWRGGVTNLGNVVVGGIIVLHKPGEE